MKLPLLPKFDVRYIYVMYTYSLPYVFKCGISKDPVQRRNEIQSAMRVVFENPKLRLRLAFPSYLAPSLFSEHQEAKIHYWLNWFNLKFNGIPSSVSGHSEWFYFWQSNFIPAVIMWVYFAFHGEFKSPYEVGAILAQPVYPIVPVLLVLLYVLIYVFIFLAVCLLIGAAIYYGTNIIHA